MKQIKFSHNYCKFGDKKLPFKALLLQTFKINYKELSKKFIDYDTMFDKGAYELPKTDLIVLLLISTDLGVFTTIRRFTPQKYDYYKKLEGKILEVIAV